MISWSSGRACLTGLRRVERSDRKRSSIRFRLVECRGAAGSAGHLKSLISYGSPFEERDDGPSVTWKCRCGTIELPVSPTSRSPGQDGLFHRCEP
jgi:hypothetical protein